MASQKVSRCVTRVAPVSVAIHISCLESLATAAVGRDWDSLGTFRWDYNGRTCCATSCEVVDNIGIVEERRESR